MSGFGYLPPCASSPPRPPTRRGNLEPFNGVLRYDLDGVAQAKTVCGLCPARGDECGQDVPRMTAVGLRGRRAGERVVPSIV